MDEKEAEAHPLMGTIFLVADELRLRVNVRKSMWQSFRENLIFFERGR